MNDFKKDTKIQTNLERKNVNLGTLKWEMLVYWIKWENKPQIEKRYLYHMQPPKINPDYTKNSNSIRERLATQQKRGQKI